MSFIQLIDLDAVQSVFFMIDTNSVYQVARIELIFMHIILRKENFIKLNYNNEKINLIG